MARAGTAKHLAACSQRAEAIHAADRRAGAVERLFRLQVRDAWGGDYWLHLEMRGTATLKDLDYYLRAIWLECCGHMSQFSIGGWRGDEIPMRTKVERVFRSRVELTHIYDFGTSSHTLIKSVRMREGKPLTSRPIVLMARNDPPEVPCLKCGQPASWLCLECQGESGEPTPLCDAHAQADPHKEDCELTPLVNSPRMGLCGYTGPADPPY